MVDLLAIITTYLSLVVPGSQYLLVIRILRILRIFRILKLVAYVGEARLLIKALRASGRKIAVFLYTVLTLVVIFGHGIIAVPTGIVTVELSQSFRSRVSTQVCPECSAEGHDSEARHCKFCGASLYPEDNQ